MMFRLGGRQAAVNHAPGSLALQGADFPDEPVEFVCDAFRTRRALVKH
jgi:hypothetical protein